MLCTQMVSPNCFKTRSFGLSWKGGKENVVHASNKRKCILSNWDRGAYLFTTQFFSKSLEHHPRSCPLSLTKLFRYVHGLTNFTQGCIAIAFSSDVLFKKHGRISSLIPLIHLTSSSASSTLCSLSGLRAYSLPRPSSTTMNLGCASLARVPSRSCVSFSITWPSRWATREFHSTWSPTFSSSFSVGFVSFDAIPEWLESLVRVPIRLKQTKFGRYELSVWLLSLTLQSTFGDRFLIHMAMLEYVHIHSIIYTHEVCQEQTASHCNDPFPMHVNPRHRNMSASFRKLLITREGRRLHITSSSRIKIINWGAS